MELIISLFGTWLILMLVDMGTFFNRKTPETYEELMKTDSFKLAREIKENKERECGKVD